MATRQGTSSATKGMAAKRSRSSSGRETAAQTGERDEHYDVISVLYHALQGAETIQQYIADAREADDEELSSFFEETAAEYAARAAQAKQLLAARLDEGSNGAGGEEDEDDDD
jgi:hypothetical protein